MVQRQSPRNQTLYADLLQDLMGSCLPTGFGMSFSRKTVKSRFYWYLTLRLDGKKIQTYIGPDTPEQRERIDARRDTWAQGTAQARERRSLIRHLAGNGAFAPTPAAGKLLVMLSEGGVFRAGGVLVGTLAFNAYANMLGIQWGKPGALRTQDIDIASSLSIALPSSSTDLKDLTEREIGFSAVPSLLWKAPSASYSGAGQHIDFLTPMIGKPQRPVFVENFSVYAEPLRYLDFITENAQAAVMLAKGGALVNVPDPGRFALHKLVVSTRRPSAMASKADKDVAQAAMLIEALIEDHPAILEEALVASHEYHGKFHTTAMRVVKARFRQELASTVLQIDAELRKVDAAKFVL